MTDRSSRIRQASIERRERQKLELRQLILRAAGDEFVEHGYERFSLRRVAERIGYSATTIYLYFRDKDDLLLATVQDGFRDFDRTLEEAARTTADPLERIEALGRAYVQFGLDNCPLYRLMFMQRSDYYLMPRLIGSGTSEEERNAPGEGAHHHVVAQDLLVAAVEEAMQAGQIHQGDVLLIADSLWAGVHGLVALASSPLMPREHAEKVQNHLLRLLLDGLKP